MKTPENFVDFSLPWCAWTRTSIGIGTYSVVVGSAPFGSVLYTKSAVEEKYPGFVSAYEALSCVGCDLNFVTDVLKFCILRAEGTDLTKFLEQAGILAKVEAALAIGLSGDELTRMLMTGSQISEKTALPDDFVHMIGPQ